VYAWSSSQPWQKKRVFILKKVQQNCVNLTKNILIWKITGYCHWIIVPWFFFNIKQVWNYRLHPCGKFTLKSTKSIVFCKVYLFKLILFSIKHIPTCTNEFVFLYNGLCHIWDLRTPHTEPLQHLHHFPILGDNALLSYTIELFYTFF
jgi:hypothetical protein